METGLDAITGFITRVGFPIFVAVWLLWRIEGALYQLRESIRLLSIILARQQGTSLEEIKQQFGNDGTQPDGRRWFR